MNLASLWEGDINKKIRVAIGILFVAMGVWIMFGEILPTYLDIKLHYVMGFIFIAYGIFKLVHAEYRENLLKQNENEGDDEDT